MAVTLERRLRRSDRVVARACDDGVILLKLDDGQYFTLDEVGARVWALCDGGQVDALVAAIQAEFDAPEDVIRSDVEELLHELTGEELVVPVE